MTWNVQDWSSVSDTMRLGGFLPWGETPTHLQVFQGDTLIHDNQFSSDMQWQEVPAGNRALPRRPRRRAAGRRLPAVDAHPHASGGSCPTPSTRDFFEPFSVLKLDYRLETDLRGDVKAGRDAADRGRAGVLDLASRPGQGHRGDAGRLLRTAGRLAAGDADQGRPAAGGRGSFRAAQKPGGFVSVRASAGTDGGYGIKQEIIRAYGLR